MHKQLKPFLTCLAAMFSQETEEVCCRRILESDDCLIISNHFHLRYEIGRDQDDCLMFSTRFRLPHFSVGYEKKPWMDKVNTNLHLNQNHILGLSNLLQSTHNKFTAFEASSNSSNTQRGCRFIH